MQRAVAAVIDTVAATATRYLVTILDVASAIIRTDSVSMNGAPILSHTGHLWICQNLETILPRSLSQVSCVLAFLGWPPLPQKIVGPADLDLKFQPVGRRLRSREECLVGLDSLDR